MHAQRAIEQHIAGGDVFSDQTIATPAEIETHPIYTEFFRKVGFGWLMSCVMLPDLDMLVALSVPRAKGKGPFGEEEMRLLGRLGRHAEQSLRISMQIANVDADAVALRTAVDAIDAAIYALDGQGKLLFSNACGYRTFDNCFCTISGKMVPRSQEARSRFEALLVAANEQSEHAPPQSCVIVGEDGKKLAVWAMPATRASRIRFGAREAERTLLFATPVERNHMIDPTVIRDVFALSLGEARLASLVGAGVEMREAASRLRITEGTARIVLKRIFKKLGFKRQAQLIRQLSSLGHLTSLHATALLLAGKQSGAASTE